VAARKISSAIIRSAVLACKMTGDPIPLIMNTLPTTAVTSMPTAAPAMPNRNTAMSIHRHDDEKDGPVVGRDHHYGHDQQKDCDGFGRSNFGAGRLSQEGERFHQRKARRSKSGKWRQSNRYAMHSIASIARTICGDFQVDDAYG
jgi:hypothetical protein